jgi:hypothetical protein
MGSSRATSGSSGLRNNAIDSPKLKRGWVMMDGEVIVGHVV